MAHPASRPSATRRRILLGAGALGLAGAGAQAAPAWTAAFSSYVDAARRRDGAPGLAVAVVEAGAVALLQGFGERALGGGQPVGPRTRFDIGSTSKAFTALSVGQLVDAGRLGWDELVSRRLPWLEHYDPTIREKMKVYDLLAAHYGIGVQTDSTPLFFASPETPARELVNRARFLKPDHGFRERYAYSNMMFIAAGELVAEVSGQPYEAYVADHVFRPAGMVTAGFEPASGPGAADGASPHAFVDGALRPITWRRLAPAMAASGGIIASVQDMAQWLKLQLGEGQVDGVRVAAAQTLARMHRQHTVMLDPAREAAQFPFQSQMASNYWGYGLGWFVSEYQGEPMVWHSGGTPGFRAGVVLFPRRRFGVAVLANKQPTNINFALALKAYDLRFGRSGPDWGALATAAAPPPPPPPAPAPGPAPSAPLAAFHGRYLDAGAFEPATISQGAEPGVLAIRLGRIAGLVRPWRGDTLAVDWDTEGWTSRQFLPFSLSEAGVPLSFMMGEYGPFRRQPT